MIYIPLCFYLYAGTIPVNSSGSVFTFHYASTYTLSGSIGKNLLNHLHSTMLLLIRRQTMEHQRHENVFTFHYASTYTSL